MSYFTKRKLIYNLKERIERLNYICTWALYQCIQKNIVAKFKLSDVLKKEFEKWLAISVLHLICGG